MGCSIKSQGFKIIIKFDHELLNPEKSCKHLIFHHPFVLNDMLLRKIKQPYKKFRLKFRYSKKATKIWPNRPFDFDITK